MNLNKVFILGRVGETPVLKSTNSGSSVTSFSIATNRVWKDKQGQKNEETEWHKIVLWGKTAEIAAQYLVKGQQAFIEGRLATREWEDKKGSKHFSTEIIGEKLQFGPKPQNAPSASHSPAPLGPGYMKQGDEAPVIDIDEEEINPEDLPF